MNTSPGTVRRSQLTNLKMVSGGEKTHPIVIDRARVREWVGFGWIDCGSADAEERAKYPLVIDDEDQPVTVGE